MVIYITYMDIMENIYFFFGCLENIYLSKQQSKDLMSAEE